MNFCLHSLGQRKAHEVNRACGIETPMGRGAIGGKQECLANSNAIYHTVL